MTKIKDLNEEYVDRQATRIGNWSISRLVLTVIGCILALSLIGGVTHYVLSWVHEGARVVGVQNVTAQWQFAYDYDRALDQIAVQYCTAKTAEDAEVDPSVRVQRTDQRIAIENLYAQRAAEYNGRLADAFRARLVRPRDVPAQAPTLQENVAQNCSVTP